LHYNARKMAGTERKNHGAQIRDAMKSLSKQGVCRESEWPYAAQHYAKRPPEIAYTKAQAHQSVWYQRLPHDLAQMKACLAEGYPFVLGLVLYEEFDSWEMRQHGVLHLPEKDAKKVGGHTVLAVGYNEVSQRFMMMNSYGTSWGQKGYFTVPYAYVLKHQLAFDFWTLRAVEE
jgi:C1A family cysteine protease